MRPVNPKTVCLTTLLRPGTGALRQVADDAAASGAPERFAFRQRANVAQAFGHDAQAWAKYQCPSHARIFKVTVKDVHNSWEDRSCNYSAIRCCI